MFGSLNRPSQLTLGASQGSRDVALLPGGPFVVSIDNMTPRVIFDGSGGAQNPTNGSKLESEHTAAPLRLQTTC